MNTLKFGNGEWYGKKDTILAYNDENSNFKPLPFSFDRASSATVINKDGLIETVGSGEPRIDYKDDAKGALLLEPSRSNLVYPSDIGTPTSGFGVRNYLAPDGTISAFYPQPNSTARRFQVIIVGGAYATNTKLIYSWYRKRVSNPSDIGFIGDLDIKGLINATQVGVTEQIESNVSGFDRFSATFNITNGSLATTLRLYYGNVIGVGNSAIAYWGHQLESNSSYATSYIPTSGGVVTRVQDVCNNGANEQVINSTEGVLYAEISALADDLTQRFISLSDGTTTNRLILGFDNSSNRIISFARVGGALSFDIKETVSNIQSYNKIAIKWKENDFALWSNGVELGIDTSGASFSSNVLNTLKFSDADGTTEIFNGNVKDVRVYNTALTDSELAALTTI